MKNALRTLVLFFVLFAGSVSAQTKIGHINFQQLLSVMPERAAATKQMETHGRSLEEQLTALQTDFQAKVAEYQKGSATMTDIVRSTKEGELRDMQQRIQNFQQLAQQEVQKKQKELFQPILEKAQEAVKNVAKDQGMTYVLDTSSGVVLYQSNESIDILPLVKVKLGIK
ncbi:OmpH family outer membrane protein [Prolixibacteraceae bacterium]|nr:OmpH family outer membrane protein [Prolixibacteraceae bacterium]